MLIEPPLDGGDVGDVAGPHPIRGAGPEIAAYQIGRRRAGASSDLPAGLAALVDAADPVEPHEPADALGVHPPALSAQLSGHLRRPVRPA